MSILRSLTTGASGLRAHSEALSVTGDNIANVSTIGFKRSRANFEDALGRSVAGSTFIAMGGTGSRLAEIQQMWSQGTLLRTDAPTDLAIQGKGFFVVRGNSGGVDGQFYSRAGQFRLDEDGYVVNPEGLRLQGYMADESGALEASISDLQVSGGTVGAVTTENVDVTANLSSTEEVPTVPWDPNDPSGTSSYSTTTTVYDSLGAAHDVTVYFRNNGGGAWEWHAMADGAEMAGGTPGLPVEGANGTINFNTDGTMQSDATTASTWNFNGATAGQTIDFDFGTSIAEGGTGLAGTTQFASASSVGALHQDGFASGQIASLSIDPDGTIQGIFDNGQRRTLGQVALADFASYDGLDRAGNNLWLQTSASGEPLIGAAGAGGRGAVVGGALEASNVDLGAEFVDLIQYQRGFSANSKVVTTADEMYQELVGLKR